MGYDMGYGISIWDAVYRYGNLPYRYGHPGYRYGIWADDMGDDRIAIWDILSLCRGVRNYKQPPTAHPPPRVVTQNMHSIDVESTSSLEADARLYA
jgi:hypothetical protein